MMVRALILVAAGFLLCSLASGGASGDESGYASFDGVVVDKDGQGISGEMPQQPNFEELCLSASIIAKGELAQKTDRFVEYQETPHGVVEFAIDKVYKGDFKECRMSVLVPVICPEDLLKSVGSVEEIEPNYVSDQEYLLFLKKYDCTDIFVRPAIENIRPERKWTRESENRLVETLEFLADPNRWSKPGDHLSYTIPEDANSTFVDLTESQEREGYSKIIRYHTGGELVGERGWYANGKLAYEKPMRYGLQHGIYKAWNRKGELVGETAFRKGRPHGISEHVERGGQLTVSYWILGEKVTREKYIQEAKKNATLELPKCDEEGVPKAGQK